MKSLLYLGTRPPRDEIATLSELTRVDQIQRGIILNGD